MPGFNDAHVHLASGGFEKLNVNLVGSKSLQEMQAPDRPEGRTAPQPESGSSAAVGTTPCGRARRCPLVRTSTPMTNGHPAIFVRVDGHIAIANTAALQAAGVTGKTQAPQGGKIDLDSKGEPTGILREGAQELVFSKVPPPTPCTTPRSRRVGTSQCGALGSHLGSGQFVVERFPGLRRTRERRQAHPPHQRVVDVW